MNLLAHQQCKINPDNYGKFPKLRTGAGRVAEGLGYGPCGAIAAMAFLPPVAGLFAKREA